MLRCCCGRATGRSAKKTTDMPLKSKQNGGTYGDLLVHEEVMLGGLSASIQNMLANPRMHYQREFEQVADTVLIGGPDFSMSIATGGVLAVCETTHVNPEHKLCMIDVHGPFRHSLKGKTTSLLLLGAAGSGKTSMANLMANYIFGSSWSSPFRIIVSEGDGDSKYRDWAIVYTFHDSQSDKHKAGFIRVADFPGIGANIFRDELIGKQIKCLIHEHWLFSVDAVCVTVHAQMRDLSPEESYTLSVLETVLHRHIKVGIFVLATFADTEQMPATDALQNAGVEYKEIIAFNSFSLSVGYAQGPSINMPLSNEPAHLWNQAEESLDLLFEEITKGDEHEVQ